MSTPDFRGDYPMTSSMVCQGRKWSIRDRNIGASSQRISVSLVYPASGSKPATARYRTISQWRLQLGDLLELRSRSPVPDHSKAAEQGIAHVQSIIAGMYISGSGVPKDIVQAYSWFSVAAANGDKESIYSRNTIAEKLTPEQLTEGQELAAYYFEQYQPRQ